MHSITLKGRGELAEWRDAARSLLAAGIPPGSIDWQEACEAGTLFGAVAGITQDVSGDAAPVTVPPAFISLAEAVICHSDPGRFALLYRLLFRLRADRQLLQKVSDADVHRALMLQKSVRRDCHKMTAFVRFKEIDLDQSLPRRRFVAWFEPDHHIIARGAPFFQRRFTDMDWMIATPEGSAAWDGQQLTIRHERIEKPSLEDEADSLWRTYFTNIFNPARLKVKAMQAEMPKKYWKNLPEADLIPGMIAGAEANVLAMAKRAATEPLPFHQRLQAAAAERPVPSAPEAGTLDALRAEARQCTRCELHCRATQTVFGEGPADASVMVVGEQPGDQEDLAGRPFVGPAGKMFDQAVAAAGIARQSLYVTNAVKHFKYEPRGKRRIHQKPNMGEVRHCRWWLDRELALVRPKLVVAMGTTAFFALTERRDRLEDVRSRPLALEGGGTLFTTVHPSYLLRIPDERKKAEELQRFREDMVTVQGLMESGAESDSVRSSGA